tara:strand:- start:17974 stop:18369 length:396 start_codon:yes stop_codon:yes gene_type:complete
MPKDSETGESYDSPKDALSAALPEGVDAGDVLKKLKDSGYSLESSGDGGSVGIAVGIETEGEEAPEGGEKSSEGSAPAGDDKELEPGGAPNIGEEETMDISMGMVGEDEPMSLKRNKVAEGLMDKFKKGMV